VGRVARMDSVELYTGNSEVENHMEQLGSFWIIILKWLSYKHDEGGGGRFD
jgi:hypothetical protein